MSGWHLRAPTSVGVVFFVVLVAIAPLAGAAGGAVGADPAGGTAGGDAAGPSPPPGQTDTPTGTPTAGQPPADNTVTRIQVYENGSARWTVRIRTRLETEQDVEEYRAFQARFRNNTSRFLDPFGERIRRVVANAAETTGRETAATDFRAATAVQEVPRRWGVVTYEFTWSGFAATREDAVVVGDVFAGGFYIGPNDTLELVAPPGHGIGAVDPRPDEREDGTLTWRGPTDFADGRPSARFVPAGATGGNGDGDTPPTGTVSPLFGGFLVAALFVLAGIGVVAYRSGRLGGPAGFPSETDGHAGRIVTDEDRVREQLRENGGQMKQSELADALGWSASKTSRVLSDMTDEGTVEKLRLGRENVIELPENGNGNGN